MDLAIQLDKRVTIGKANPPAQTEFPIKFDTHFAISIKENVSFGQKFQLSF
jgi:hypothetical protein